MWNDYVNGTSSCFVNIRGWQTPPAHTSGCTLLSWLLVFRSSLGCVVSMLGGLRIRFNSCCWLCFRLMMMLQDCCCFYGDRILLSGLGKSAQHPLPPAFKSSSLLSPKDLPAGWPLERKIERKKEGKKEREVAQSCPTLWDPMGCSNDLFCFWPEPLFFFLGTWCLGKMWLKCLSQCMCWNDTASVKMFYSPKSEYFRRPKTWSP